MSYVAPVTAVLLMMWTANAAMSAGPTTRRMGSVARSSSRRLSSSSPRIDADRGVSTKPAAIRLTRIGASSSARLAMRVGNATVAVEAIARPTRGRRAPVPPMNTRDHPVFHEAEALAGVSHRKLAHPTAQHRVDQLHDPINRLRLVAAEHILELA